MTDQAADIQRHRTADPRSLPVADLARLLSVSEEKIREHIVAGAPTAADGTINLVHYAAWLVRETSGFGPQASGEEDTDAPASCSPQPEARGPRPGGSHHGD